MGRHGDPAGAAGAAGLHFAGGESGPKTFQAAGAYVMGWRMADGREVPWGEEPPFRAPMVVVTDRPHRSWSARGGTNGLVAAVERAHAAAGGKDVAVASGGTLLSQVLRAGPLDELELHIAPVLVGDGMRLLTDLDLDGKEGIELHPDPDGARRRGHPHPVPDQRPREAGAGRPRHRHRHPGLAGASGVGATPAQHIFNSPVARWSADYRKEYV